MKYYQPHNMLITGGAGFIGANFIRHILTNDPQIKVTNLDLLTYAGSLDNLNNLPNQNNYQFVQGDICNQTLVKQLLNEFQIDTIVHFAAESHVDRSIQGPETFIKTNVLGTFNLLEAAKQYWLEQKHWQEMQCRFHHISTDEVYGTLSAENPAFTESTPYAPNSPYSASKAGSDHLVRAYYHTYGLPVTTTNCSNNYGPYQHPEKFIPTVIRNCLSQKSIPIYGDGTNIRDWLYVEDHCDGILTVLQAGNLGEVYNIGGDNECSNIELVKVICQLMDELQPQNKPHNRLIEFVKDRPGHDWRYAINSSKITNKLGWLPKEDFSNGLRQTIKFYAKT